MRALTWQAPGRVGIAEVPEPRIEQSTDAVVRITSTAICGSDLHLYDFLGSFLSAGDILGHEPIGIVEETGADVRRIAVGDRVVVSFVIACGECVMCRRGLTTQCETTQNRAHGTGASLFGYTELYGAVPGAQAERLRVPLADVNALKVGPELPDDRYLFLSDILLTAWQAFEYARLPEGGVLGVLGEGENAAAPGVDVALSHPRGELFVEQLQHGQRVGCAAVDAGERDRPGHCVRPLQREAQPVFQARD